jgi:putative ABC transport system substrate-binding protein
MRRRDFIATFSATAAAWPLATLAQQPGRVRRVGVLTAFSADDPEGQARLMAFGQSLQQLGWTVGRNLQVDIRWGASDAERIRGYAAELLALGPDVILVNGSPEMKALQQATRSVPIVFANVTDPVSQGFVASIARPGGNVTGFAASEFGQSGKWLELLKEIAPGVNRVAVLLNRSFSTGMAQLAAIQAVAPSLGIEVSPIDVHDATELEQLVTAFARAPKGGLILTGAGTSVRRELVMALAARHHLPTVYPLAYLVSNGGLASYGPDTVDQYRLAAGYVDRILKGEKPADLPVQTPTNYRLAINLKTAKALGLTVPTALLARAEMVIE